MLQRAAPICHLVADQLARIGHHVIEIGRARLHVEVLSRPGQSGIGGQVLLAKGRDHAFGQLLHAGEIGIQPVKILLRPGLGRVVTLCHGLILPSRCCMCILALPG